MSIKKDLTDLDDLGTLAELSRELGENKSKLSYYFNLGLLAPKKAFSQTLVFNKQEVKETLAEIKKASLTGKGLRDLAEGIRRKNK